jgi:hypothetical protein
MFHEPAPGLSQAAINKAQIEEDISSFVFRKNSMKSSPSQAAKTDFPQFSVHRAKFIKASR